jgi:DNA invertase Pin-like site-specific DNA recombinase
VTEIGVVGRFIAYFRISTDRQGRSGLGLNAQREAVLRHVASNRGELVGEFCEIESGKRNDRPQLAAEIAAAKRAKATLIIANRLARNVHFVSGLMESGVDFVAADNPHANKLMVHLPTAFAEHEREQIRRSLQQCRWNRRAVCRSMLSRRVSGQHSGSLVACCIIYPPTARALCGR